MFRAQCPACFVRYSPGVIPAYLRKILEKWLCDEKPRSADTLCLQNADVRVFTAQFPAAGKEETAKQRIKS